MHQYKKRLRLFAQRYGMEIEYLHDGGLALQKRGEHIEFSPNSVEFMTCTLSTPAGITSFSAYKHYVFDIAHLFALGRSLEKYAPQYPPLKLEEYLEEECAESLLAELRQSIQEGTAINRHLGGNHYYAEYFNGILIVWDDITGAPTNVFQLDEHR